MLGNISYSIFIYIDKHIEEGENGDQTYLHSALVFGKVQSSVPAL